jgi:hypothetical protein
MASPGTPGGLSVARGFDRELTRDFAKRESALRFEVEKWRARAEALTEENETFRASVETARRRNADAEGHFALQSRELDRLRAQAVGEGAARAARLEEQCERQRRMLRELAVASEALAKDNVLLSSELVALRDRGDEAESLAETLSERLKSARRLYLANQKSLARAEETRSALPDGQWEKKLNELLTADVLARSKPPPAFPAEASDKARAPLVAVAPPRAPTDFANQTGILRRREIRPRLPGAGKTEAARGELCAAQEPGEDPVVGDRVARAESAHRRRARRRAPRLGRQGADGAGAARGRRAAAAVAGGARGRAGGVREGEGRVRRVARKASARAAQDHGRDDPRGRRGDAPPRGARAERQKKHAREERVARFPIRRRRLRFGREVAVRG